MYNRRHCYPHKSTDSAWQKPETHAPMPNSNPSAFSLPSRRFVLSHQWLCFSLISYIIVAVEKYIFQVRRNKGRASESTAAWHRRHSPLFPSWPSRIPWNTQQRWWWSVSGGRAFQLLLGATPKLNAEKTSLSSNVKPPCCHCPSVLCHCVHLLKLSLLILTERCHQQLIPGGIPILHSQ